MLTAVVGAKRRLHEHAARLETVRNQWRGAGLHGDPSTESLQAALSSMVDTQQRIVQCDARHKALVEGYAAWLKSQEYRQRQHKIAETIAHEKVASDAVVTETLESRVASFRSLLVTVRNAREFRERAIKKLEDEARNYASSVLKPLNNLNQKFLQVFSCFSNMSVTLDARTHKSSSRLEFMLNWLSGSIESNTSASIRHILSEGQVSALSVSLLLSMSAAYRWSRWKALALDDPLQHNDVVHAASFVEVLRNLVRYEGYQVILSTHDFQLADFIRRKMVSAKVDCRTCEFLEPRTNGMVFRVL
jgi:ABC-type enterochelin transport system ATPase subunit